jgi:spermidine synthase
MPVRPWTLLDTATVPGGGPNLRLLRRGDEFSIVSGAIELMNSRVSGSEKALATLTVERLAARQAPSLLIGGLGMGFTLRAALAVLPPEAKVVVAELVPAVVAWARGPMAAVFADCLADPRVTIQIGDVGAAMRHSTYDAILLDVDNGPDGLTRPSNDGLYGASGLARAREALNPGGVLSVWSSAPDDEFTRRLGQGGFAVEAVTVRANGTKGARHTIWLAIRARRS